MLYTIHFNSISPPSLWLSIVTVRLNIVENFFFFFFVRSVACLSFSYSFCCCCCCWICGGGGLTFGWMNKSILDHGMGGGIKSAGRQGIAV